MKFEKVFMGEIWVSYQLSFTKASGSGRRTKTQESLALFP